MSGDFFGGPGPQRLIIDRMRKRVGLLPPPQSTMVALRTWENLDADGRQRIANRLAQRMRRALPPGAELCAELRIVEPPDPYGMSRAEQQRRRQIEVTVCARRRRPRMSGLDALSGRVSPEQVMARLRASAPTGH